MQGSVINRIMEGPTSQEPYVGMPITFTSWSDRDCGIIVEVSPSGKSFKAVAVKATRIDNNSMSESQRYEYSGIPGAEQYTSTWTLRRNGRFVKVGNSMRGGGGVILGVWDAYYDYSF